MKKVLSAVAVLTLLAQISPAWADSGDMMSMLESMKQQMAKMQDTIDRQNSRIQQLESRSIETPRPNETIQPSQPTTMSDADFQKSLKDNIGEAIPWLKGAKFGGDFRLRYEAFDFYDRKSDAGSVTGANDRVRNRFRIRLRWGFEKD